MRRRTFMAGLAALGFMPLNSRAAAEDPGSVADRLLSFDVAEVLDDLLELTRAPKRYRRALSALLEGRDTARGLASVHALAQDDEMEGEVVALLERFERDLGAKLWLLRTVRRAPQTEEGRSAMRAWFYRRLGLDMEGLRAAVEALPVQDMALVFGPVTTGAEMVGYMLREPWVLALQIAHGRRLVEIRGRSAQDLTNKVVDVLVDPSVRCVCTQGHGTWNSLSLHGHYIDPEETLARLCTQAGSAPVDLIKRVVSGSLRKLLGRGAYYGALTEERLAVLAAQLPHQPGVWGKDLIVRYTCGSERYQGNIALLRSLMDDTLKDKLDISSDGFAPHDPSVPPGWADEMRSWLADKRVDITAAPGWGSSFVRRPQDVRGYDGLAWIHDFVAHPVPEYAPPEVFIRQGTRRSPRFGPG
jgi:hypothetical protein